MPRLRIRSLSIATATALSIAVAIAPPVEAEAQMMPPPGGQFEEPRQVPEGPAEQGEEEPAEAQPPELPPYLGREARTRFFEVGGYFRTRADLFHNLQLGFGPDQALDGPLPFFTPLSESDRSAESLHCQRRRELRRSNPDVGFGDDLSCPPKTLTGANLRLRLDPTFHVNDLVSVKAQVDLLDNLVLGSTPDGYYYGRTSPDNYTPVLAFSGTQVPPEAGRNSRSSSVRVKRAWGDVHLGFGKLLFGRMPSHWGMGVLANDGNCLDCDYGDNADRLVFATAPFGHQIALGYDFAASGPTTFQGQPGSTAIGPERYQGQAIDADQLDDVDQLLLVVRRYDKPDEFREQVLRGDLALNYGAYLVWRKQDFDFEDVPAPPGDRGPDAIAQGSFRHRGAWALIPDLWLKMGIGGLEVEFEGVYIHGHIAKAPVSTPPGEVDVRMWGFAARTLYRALKDSLEVGMEVGAASGDDAELVNLYQLGSGLNLQPPCPPDRAGCTQRVTAFRFDPDYHVDLILFREILGTVTNALYVKPHIQYQPARWFLMRLDVIPSFALQPVATPGNASFWGLELDAKLAWNRHDARTGIVDFTAWFQYGIFFPGGALDRPADLRGEGDAPVWAHPKDAEVAHTLQVMLGVPFE